MNFIFSLDHMEPEKLGTLTRFSLNFFCFNEFWDRCQNPRPTDRSSKKRQMLDHDSSFYVFFSQDGFILLCLWRRASSDPFIFLKNFGNWCSFYDTPTFPHFFLSFWNDPFLIFSDEWISLFSDFPRVSTLQKVIFTFETFSILIKIFRNKSWSAFFEYISFTPNHTFQQLKETGIWMKLEFFESANLLVASGIQYDRLFPIRSHRYRLIPLSIFY